MAVLRSYLRRMWRAALTPDAVLTFEEAVEAMPSPNPRTRQWLLEQVEPAGELAGEVVYRWGDVLAAMTQPTTEVASPLAEVEDARWLTTEQAALRLNIARSTLDEMVAQAPKTMEGAPVSVGGGRHRNHLRWDGERLDDWMSAYQQWQATRRKRRRKKPVRVVPTPTSPAPKSKPPRSAPDPTRKRRHRRGSSLLTMVTAEGEGR
ncbi:MAG: hypothetical protein ACI8RZ_006055 [Myxococcota bacterium]|jgi:hypothetical protein